MASYQELHFVIHGALPAFGVFDDAVWRAARAGSFWRRVLQSHELLHQAQPDRRHDKPEGEPAALSCSCMCLPNDGEQKDEYRVSY